MPTTSEGGLGEALVGEKIAVNNKHVSVSKLLGEGGFSYVYLCKDIAEGKDAAERKASGSAHSRRSGSMSGKGGDSETMVLKVTSIVTRTQRDIAEKEAKLLAKLSHPSIVKMIDTCYRAPDASARRGSNNNQASTRPQHLILMEYCEGGHALDACTALKAAGKHYQLSELIIAFGQVCNAVSYLHAQRPPIVHRDLKPANFLVQGGAFKLCDFGSAIFGHVDLKTPQNRNEADEVIQKTTTQMFRAPEMVDLYMAKKLTQATDVWALGCCLYSMAFLQNCFEEGSNLAILNANYKIPEDNPYGSGLVELLDRMLTVDHKERADMTQVILCLSAVYSGKELPPRKKKKKDKDSSSSKEGDKDVKDKKERTGTYRTDGQGRVDDGVVDLTNPGATKDLKAKALNKNSAAYRRRQAAGASAGGDKADRELNAKFDKVMTLEKKQQPVNEDAAFSASANPFADFNPIGSSVAASGTGSSDDVFNSFESDDVIDTSDLQKAFASKPFASSKGGFDGDASMAGMSVMTESGERGRGRKSGRIGMRRARSKSRPKKKLPEETNSVKEAPVEEEEKKVVKPRRIRSVVPGSEQPGDARRGRSREDAPSSRRSRSVGRRVRPDA